MVRIYSSSQRSNHGDANAIQGIFFTLFWITLWVLLKDRTNSNRFLIGALLFMLILSTVVSRIKLEPIFTRLTRPLQHIILDFVRVIEGFIVHRDSRLGGPIGTPYSFLFVG